MAACVNRTANASETLTVPRKKKLPKACRTPRVPEKFILNFFIPSNKTPQTKRQLLSVPEFTEVQQKNQRQKAKELQIKTKPK